MLTPKANIPSAHDTDSRILDSINLNYSRDLPGVPKGVDKVTRGTYKCTKFHRNALEESKDGCPNCTQEQSSMLFI